MKTDPYELFSKWYLPIRDSGKENSNAVVLSTSSEKGRVSSRVVLLKYFDRNGFVFFSNYKSKKGGQLEQNHMASLLFYWPLQSRQIRIEGRVKKTSNKESDEYFNSRIPGHKINAVVSKQSKPIDNIDQYMERLEAARELYKNTCPSRPDYWGGYRLVPDRFEFWEEGKDRFHTRQEFIYDGTRWNERLLQP